MKKVLLLILGLISFLLVAACTPAAPGVELPEGMIKLSELVPGHGEHWANPDNPHVGPIYLVHGEEVIGIEYMFTTDAMEEIPMTDPDGGEIFKHLLGLPLDVHVNHMHIEYFMPKGREGFTVPHFVVHLYFISAEKLEEAIIPLPVGNNQIVRNRRFE